MPFVFISRIEIETDESACDNDDTVRTYAVRQTEGLAKTALNGFGFGRGSIYERRCFVNYFCTSRRGGNA